VTVAARSDATEHTKSYVAANGIRMIPVRAGSFMVGNARTTDPAPQRQWPVFTHGA